MQHLIESNSEKIAILSDKIADMTNILEKLAQGNRNDACESPMRNASSASTQKLHEFLLRLPIGCKSKLLEFENDLTREEFFSQAVSNTQRFDI